MYVTDDIKITLRTGQGIDHKILAMIKPGQEVEVLQPDDEWTQVQLPNGMEGWVLTRFLTHNKPCCLEFEVLKKNMQLFRPSQPSCLKKIESIKRKAKDFAQSFQEVKRCS